MTSFYSKYIWCLALFLVPCLTNGQYLITGHVFEKTTRNPIPDVLVFDSLEFKNTTTDLDREIFFTGISISRTSCFSTYWIQNFFCHF